MSLNSSSMTYGTISQNGVQMHIMPGNDGKPAGTPSGLLVTRSLETKAGWVGQIIIDKEIVWESAAFDTADDAMQVTNNRVVGRVRKMFE